MYSETEPVKILGAPHED